jgi:hypothetical protein
MNSGMTASVSLSKWMNGYKYDNTHFEMIPWPLNKPCSAGDPKSFLFWR